MASVSVVSSADFRANLAPAQNSAPEGDDPFSLLLNSVADVKAGPQRPDAPRVAERRSDPPAKPPKPEADADRQAKRQAKDAAEPDSKPQAETQPAVKPKVDDGDEEAESQDGDPATAEALLAIALTDTQEQTVPTVQTNVGGDAEIAGQNTAVPAVTGEAEAAAAIQTLPTANADDAGATTQSTQATAAAKPKFEIPPAAAQSEADAEIAAPKISVETVSSLVKPLKAVSSFEVPAQPQAQSGPVQVAAASAPQGPAPLETLQAAISKHVQLSLGLDANETAPEASKPLVSSNAVAPNFAMTAQVNAPVALQTQTAAEASRAVPLDQVAVEIATRVGKGERRFDIRLDPPELGRIDVRLEIDSKGNTTTKLIVERAETLDMLQRDARGLEKALQNAGLKTDAGGLQFSLQQDTQAQHGNRSHAPELHGRPDLARDESEIVTEVSINSASLAAQLRGGVDIRI